MNREGYEHEENKKRNYGRNHCADRSACDDEEEKAPVEKKPVKECTGVIRGLSEHTVRQLIAQGKLPSIRTGQGVRGKILVNKADLLAYFTGV